MKSLFALITAVQLVVPCAVLADPMPGWMDGSSALSQDSVPSSGRPLTGDEVCPVTGVESAEGHNLVQAGRLGEERPADNMATGAMQQPSVQPDTRHDPLQNLRRRAAILLSGGKVEEAIRVLGQGIKAARRRGETTFEVGRALNDLGTFYLDMYRLPEALRCYSAGVAVMKRCCPSSPGMIVLLNNIARLRLVEARYAEAEKVYREAQGFALRQPELDTPSLAQTYLGLAETFISTNRYDEAQVIAEQTLSLLKHSDDEVSASALFLLARLASLRGNRADSEHLLRRALQKWKISVGAAHTSYAIGLAGLAMLLSSKKPAEAERLFKKALEIVEANLGGNHYFHAEMTVQYSTHLRSHGRKEEADKLSGRAQAIMTEQALRNRIGYTVDVQALRSPRTVQ